MTDRGFIPDAQQREQVLDPAQSFIVQAPAGSGKTTLLIQRYLRLLSCVDAPEEIVAITFTRKAAAEMRTRVLNALGAADQPVDAETAHANLNRELSLAVLRRNEQAGWHIAENPQRLRIQTIDSLCAALTQQMPVLSTFGAQPEITEDASELYLEAVRATLALIDRDHEIAFDIEQLFEHLDNDRARIESLLMEMLAKRDHWLRHLRASRQELEESLQHSRHNAVQFVSGLLPSGLHEELLALLHYSAANLTIAGISSPITACNELTSFALADVEHWQSVAELLLNKDGDWRKKLSVREGFPPGSSTSEKKEAKAWKNRLEMLIQSLAAENTFRQALQDVRTLPPPRYANPQWEILAVITRLLPYAVAQLNVVFQAHGKVDFSEVTQRALLALGDVDAPTDLALALDHRIKHIMIDEFQDTSISQFMLIEKLIAGWEAGDGRTLFAVGDPMQSIYRFREAEVGLFLQARNNGIGQLVLQPITLSANFRSQQGIIDWVNSAFARIMPDCENVAMGAVAYTPSIAMHAALVDDAVKIYPCWGRDDANEARQVVEIIKKSRLNDPTGTIAILVRNRNHLIAIVEHISQARMRFRAIDIELLHHKAVVQDLLALTRVLMNPSDQIAWFALLRAPWCGLLLRDLNVLAESNPGLIKKEMTVWQLINDENCWHAISADARARLSRLKVVLQPCMNHRRRQSLRNTVEAAWMALGGPGANIKKGNEEGGDSVQDAQIFLDYLESHEQAGILHDQPRFEQGLSKLYANPDLAADGSLQIMTIHKAKGLEFDTVIVPGLGRAPKNNKKQLLKWMEQPAYTFSNKDGAKMDLLLAPIQEVGTASDSIYQWIEKLDQDKALFEADRLLYVAATRAKKFLHLLGHTGLSSDDGGKMIPSLPMSHSLLSRLWPSVAPIYHAIADCHASKDDHVDHEDCATLNQENYCNYRLPADWTLPDAPPSVIWRKPPDYERIQEEIQFSWATQMARHVGNVVHRWLQRIAEDEMQNWTAMRVRTLHDQFKHNLLADGMSGTDQEIESALDRVITALTNAISDERGRWILGAQQYAQNELKITATIDHIPTNWIIDRTFLDSTGIRWIIDYKIGSHEGSDIEEFLDREKIRYQHQLDRYAYIMQQLDSRVVKRGIYFPLIRGWREW